MFSLITVFDNHTLQRSVKYSVIIHDSFFDQHFIAWIPNYTKLSKRITLDSNISQHIPNNVHMYSNRGECQIQMSKKYI